MGMGMGMCVKKILLFIFTDTPPKIQNSVG